MTPGVGRTGDTVAKAQALLKVPLHLPIADRNGFYDRVTLAAVKKVQKAAGLTQDGVVRGEEWWAMKRAR